MLYDVVLSNCRQQAIVLVGPGAVLKARNVTFTGHGSDSHAMQGIVIFAQQATVLLDSVVITSNKGLLPSGPASFHPACTAANIANASISATASPAAVCGAPVLTSSLLFLQDSTFVASNTSITGNAAGALISTTGTSTSSLQLLGGSQVRSNMATWLLVADSLAADAVGRANLLAPHPSEQTKLRAGGTFEPPYTTYTLLQSIKGPQAQELPAAASAAAWQPYIGRAPRGQVGWCAGMHAPSVMRE